MCISGSDGILAPSTMMAHWDFDEGAGNLAIDSSGSGNNGTMIGATWCDSLQGSGLLFYDDEGLVTVEDSSSLDITGPISIEIWFAPLGFSGNGMTDGNILVCKYTSTPVGQYAIATYGGGGIRFWLSGEGDFEVLDVPSALTDHRWHYLACTWDTEVMRMYVDGELVGSEETSFHELRSAEYANDHLTIGHHSLPGKVWPFMGIIDDISITARCLGIRDIDSSFHGTVEGDPSFEVPVEMYGGWDIDEDGLQDDWEMDEFGTLSYGPADDNDDDGFVNLQEYSYGSDPNDPDDFGPSRSFLVRWLVPILVVNGAIVMIGITVPAIIILRKYKTPRYASPIPEVLEERPR